MRSEQEKWRATDKELMEFSDGMDGLRLSIVRERWMAPGDIPSLAGLALAFDVGVLEADAEERRLFRALRRELGESTPHPVYDMPISMAELEEQAALVRQGRATHREVARRLRIGTRRARELLGPMTRLMHGSVAHGARAYFEHGCRCEICVSAVAEVTEHYTAGGEARVGVDAPDLAQCQESSRVYFTAGHHDPARILGYCARVGLDVDEVRLRWWRKQRTRLWWTDDPAKGTNEVTVVAKRFPEVHTRVLTSARGRRQDQWVRRWIHNQAEDEVVSEALAPGEKRTLVDVGLCDGSGFPQPTRIATHFGVEWDRMPA